jgi:hypothetical protein
MPQEEFNRTGVLRFAQDDTQKRSQNKTNYPTLATTARMGHPQEQEQVPHPPPKQGGRVGQPAPSSLSGWREGGGEGAHPSKDFRVFMVRL